MISLVLALAAASPEPLDALFASVNHSDTPGCSVDIRRLGQPDIRRTYGMANLENPTPITASTVFEAGSVSKQFAAAGIALLASQGRLSLDDSVRRWLPELPKLYAPITLQMLLNHTSGIRSWNNLAELTGRGEDSTGYDNSWVLRAVARQTRLNNMPGAEYLYSNSNFVLAAIIAERASGQPLNRFFHDALFARLGMTHTQWRSDFRAIIANRAQAYAPDEAGSGWRLDMPFNDVAGAGGLMTTTGDLQRWNAVLADPAPEDRDWVAMLSVPGRLSDGTRTQYGLGLELDPIAGVPALSHAGSTASYRAWLGRFPSNGLSVALLCNAGSLNTEDLGPEVAALYLPSLPAPAQAPLRPGAAPSGVAGLYRNIANDTVVTVSLDGGAVRFNGGARFAATAPDRLGSADGTRQAVLTRDANGKVTAIALGRVGNAPVQLVAVQGWTPGSAELSRLAGRYRSDEIGADQALKFADGALSWVDPAGDVHPLKPIYRDGFEAPGTGWTLRLLRDRAGAVTAVIFSITRARQIAFRRIPV